MDNLATSPTPSQDTTAAYYAAHGPLRAPRTLRLALTWCERAVPALAARAAVRLFCTPLPLRPRRPRPMPGWHSETLPFDGASLALHHLPAALGARQAKGTALLVHGWGGHAGQLVALADVLAADGWAVVALELPAHGAARGRTSHLPQFARGIEYAAARLTAAGKPPQLLVAHSLGGNAAAHAVSRGLGVERLVLLAPAASPHAYTRLFAHAFGMSERLRAALQARIESSAGVLMADFEATAMAPRLPVPLLVVHDRGDRINPVADGEAFAHGAPHGDLLRTDGLGHRKLLADPAVLARIAAFASEIQAKSGSGAQPVSADSY